MRLARTYRIAVAGESFRNDDGTSRQKLLAKAKPWMDVDLEPESDNPHDTEAVAVWIVGLGQVGYLPSGHGLFDDVETGLVEAKIDQLTGGTVDKPSHGLVLEIQIFEDDPAQSAAPLSNAAEPASKPAALGSSRPASANRSIVAAFVMLFAIVFAFGWFVQRAAQNTSPQSAMPRAAAPATPQQPPATTISSIAGPDTPSGRRPLNREEIVELQQGLIRAGFAIGPADGIPGSRTRSALRSLELLAGWSQTDLGPVAAHLDWIRAQKL
jgi:hypothetical protein